ncbi:MAG: EcsC family protein [Acidimicrobiales bacterium]
MAFRKSVAQKAAKKAFSSDMIPEPVLAALGKAMVEGVDRAVSKRWQRALDRAAKTQGSKEQRLAELRRSFQKELTSAGAATGAAAATPGLGTAAAASWLSADVAWLALRSTDLIMTIAAVHGHTVSTPEQRRAWVLAIFAFGDSAAVEFASLVDKANLNPAGVSGAKMPLEVIERLNQTLGAHVLAKYGTRRGIATVGRLLPFGVGAVIGGGANYTMTRTLAKQADQFFRSPTLAATGFANAIDADSSERLTSAVNELGAGTILPNFDSPTDEPTDGADQPGRRWFRR